MSDFKPLQLWDACSSGNLDLVKELVGTGTGAGGDDDDSFVNVNWVGSKNHDTLLHHACRHQQVEVARFLLGHPNIQVNAANKNWATPFLVVCHNGNMELAKLFLADPRVLVNVKQIQGANPFYMACAEGQMEVVSLLLKDMRIDINTPSDYRSTPIWAAVREGHIELVRLILVSGRHVDIKTKTSPWCSWGNTTPAEVGRYIKKRIRYANETEEEYTTSTRNGPLIADLLDDYEAHPTAIRQQLRERPELRDPFISDLFSLIIFLCDDLLTFTQNTKLPLFTPPFFAIFTDTATNKMVRFFHMAQKLPMELQMMLCNRAFGSMKDFVSTQHSEPAFRHLAKSLLTESSSTN